MTREQQRKQRELNAALAKMLKEKCKQYHLKKKDYMIWKRNHDLFFDCLMDVHITKDDNCICTTKETIKPLWIDDLLWDFLKMPENKEQPLSLRAIGAFTIRGVELYQSSTDVKNCEIGELETVVDRYLAHFSQTVQNAKVDDFYQNISYSTYHEELRIALSLVHEKKYEEALSYLQDKGEGRFCNGSVWIHTAIIEFCKKQLQHGEAESIEEEFHIRRARKEELKKIADFIVERFEGLEQFTLIYEDFENAKEVLKKVTLSELFLYLEKGDIFIEDTQGLHAVIVGIKAAHFHYPNILLNSLKTQKYVSGLSKKDLLTFKEKMKLQNLLHDRKWFKKYDKNCYYITQIAVAKDKKGSGLFRRMITPILEECVKKNMCIALETFTKSNVGMYEHFGFELVETHTNENVPFSEYCMIKRK